MPDAKRTLAELYHALADDPSSELFVIALLGAAGKRTTARVIHSILGMAGYQAGLVSSIAGTTVAG